MRKNVRMFFLTSVFLLLSGCHLLERKAVKSEKAEKRGIAADLTGYGGVSPQSGSIPAFVFRRIPAGEFQIGSPQSERSRGQNEAGRDGHPVRVRISKSFDIMETEVTQKQWYQVMGKNPSYFKSSVDCVNWDGVIGMCPDHPVERVSWEDVQVFIKELNRLSGLRGCKGGPKDPKGCYRLPTEAEWEYAVRAGSKTAYFFGNEERSAKMSRGRRMIVISLKDYAWYTSNSRGGNRVKTRKPNPWGLYDVYGNVWEWVQDAYVERLPGGRDPLVATGSNRVLRGGGWLDGAGNLRSASRDGKSSGLKYDDFGFRLVRTL